LDTTIDRALKRFVQIKAMKQLMNSGNLHLFTPDGTPPASTPRTR